MDPIIRKGRAEDAAAITRLNRDEMGYDYPADKTEEKLSRLLRDDSHIILVAEHEGRVAAYIHGEIYELLYFPLMVNIMGIAVDSSCRRMGLGKALISALEDRAREKGAEALRLVSGAQRKEAHRFYESCGFTGGKQQLNYRKSIGGKK